MNCRANRIALKPVKSTIKRCIQHVAAAFGRHTRKHKEPQLLVLMYHRILPHNDQRSLIEEPGMMVTPETLKLHINILKHSFEFVKLTDWIQLKNEGKQLPAKACAITFDDGWVDNFEYAFPVLRELHTPATIFLVSDMIGTNKTFWPERIARLMTTISQEYPEYWSHQELEWLQKDRANYQFSDVPPIREELSTLIASVKKYSDKDIHDRLDHVETTLQLKIKNQSPSLLNWQQVTEMIDSGLVEMGSHTCNHIRLDKHTDITVLRHEILTSRDTIEANTGHKVKTFCFPNGDYCPEALTLVKQHYASAVTTESGWNTHNCDNYCLQRIGIHQDISHDKISFLARISDWM